MPSEPARSSLSSLLSVLAALVCLLASSTADAWNYDEHESIGTSAFTEACATIRRTFALGRDELARWELACGDEMHAKLYGQACALAGDHLNSPEAFLTAAGRLDANSTVTYLSEALQNGAHFHPDAKRRWAEHHLEALQLAESAALEREHLERYATLMRALYTSAYADHFLQDAFSSGHSGFCRECSSPMAAKMMHDLFIRTGRWMKNRNTVFCALGDGRIRELSARASDVLRSAERDSIADVLVRFVRDERYDRFQIAASDALPIALEDSGPVKAHAIAMAARTVEEDEATTAKAIGGSPTKGPVSADAMLVIPADVEADAKRVDALITVLARRGKLPGCKAAEADRRSDPRREPIKFVPIDGLSRPAYVSRRVDIIAWSDLDSLAMLTASYGRQFGRLHVRPTLGVDVALRWDPRDIALGGGAGFAVPLYYRYPSLFSYEFVGSVRSRYRLDERRRESDLVAGLQINAEGGIASLGLLLAYNYRLEGVSFSKHHFALGIVLGLPTRVAGGGAR